MKNISSVLILVILIVVLYFWFHKPTPRYSNDKEQQYYNTIDSLNKEIAKDKQRIASLDSIKNVLAAQIARDKKDLEEAAKRAAEYREQYEEERNRLAGMSNADIASKFTKTFK
jgi:predicted  nucleic acid-binding Zn-ribbon protein